VLRGASAGGNPLHWFERSRRCQGFRWLVRRNSSEGLCAQC
jgi:hypothetical protein